MVFTVSTMNTYTMPKPAKGHALHNLSTCALVLHTTLRRVGHVRLTQHMGTEVEIRILECVVKWQCIFSFAWTFSNSVLTLYHLCTAICSNLASC